MTKRYYWLKVKEDFFNSREIKKLRKLAGGDTYTIIFLKMQLLCINNNCIIEYEGTESSIAEQLSLELDEDVENVKMTIMFLQSNHLIEISENQDLLISSAQKNIGSETESAVKKREYRQKISKITSGQCLQEDKTLSENIKTMSFECPNNVITLSGQSPTDIDKDIDKEKEEEKENPEKKFWEDNRVIFQSNKFCYGEMNYADFNSLQKLADDDFSIIPLARRQFAQSLCRQAKQKMLTNEQMYAVRGLLLSYSTGQW